MTLGIRRDGDMVCVMSRAVAEPKPLAAFDRPTAAGQKMAVGALILLISAAAIWGGLKLRNWVWDFSQPARFHFDLDNAWRWGGALVQNARDESHTPADQIPPWPNLIHSYLEIYDHITSTTDNYELDYGPVRLAVMTSWVRNVQAHRPGAATWEDADLWPLLLLNSICELLAAAGAFVLVRYWVNRESPTSRGWMAGLAAGLLMWFNIAVLVDGHAWPQWDVWVLPFYTWAMVAASMCGWLTAGLLIGAGAMMKGQVLIAAPVLAFWALFMGRPMAVVKMGVGLAFAWALLTWPWLVRTLPAGVWMGTVALATVLMSRWFVRRPLGRWWWILAIISAGLILWPWATPRHWDTLFWALLLTHLLIAGPWLMRDRTRSGWVLAILGGCAFLAAIRFDGSFSWFTIGIAYGTDHFREMAIGPCYNLPALLQNRFGWTLLGQKSMVDLSWLGFDNRVNLRVLLRGIYAITLVLCGLGAAIQARRNSPRVLAALTAPWILLFVLLPQMHERYLIWGAALSAVWIGVSVGLSLLHLVVTVAAIGPMLADILPQQPPLSLKFQRFFTTMHPDAGWMMLLIAAILLYIALAPVRKRPARKHPALLPQAAPSPVPESEPTADPLLAAAT